jgi:hypothetical protein
MRRLTIRKRHFRIILPVDAANLDRPASVSCSLLRLEYHPAVSEISEWMSLFRCGSSGRKYRLEDGLCSEQKKTGDHIAGFSLEVRASWEWHLRVGWEATWPLYWLEETCGILGLRGFVHCRAETIEPQTGKFDKLPGHCRRLP